MKTSRAQVVRKHRGSTTQDTFSIQGLARVTYGSSREEYAFLILISVSWRGQPARKIMFRPEFEQTDTNSNTFHLPILSSILLSTFSANDLLININYIRLIYIYFNFTRRDFLRINLLTSNVSEFMQVIPFLVFNFAVVHRIRFVLLLNFNLISGG